MISAALPPYTELSPVEMVRQAAIGQVIGLGLLVMHVVLSKLGLPFYPVTLLLIGWLHYRSPLTGILIFFQWLIYQNWLISIFSVGMDYTTFSALQGSSFALLVLLSGISFTRLLPSGRWGRAHRPLLTAVKIALFAATVYGALGAAKAGVTPAATYFREASSLLLAVPIGLDVGRVWGFKTIATGFLVSAVLSVAINVVEIAAPVEYYDLVNAPNYMNLKYTNVQPSVKDKTDITTVRSGEEMAEFNVAVLFNITGSESDIKSFRFMGTIIHSVSDGYLLAAIAITALSIGASQWLIIIIPMLIMIGVKGANLLVACTVVLWLIWSISRSRKFLLASGLIMMTGYVAFGIWFGMLAGDLHVIGFLGGIKGLLANPIGRGLGVGGNFSPQGLQHMRWGVMQEYGLDFAVESAVGVLIYQMGLAFIAILAVIFMLLRLGPFDNRRPERRVVVFLALATVAVNGIFQEEAYTSYACGFFTLLCSIVIANGYRRAVTSTGTASVAYRPRRQAMA